MQGIDAVAPPASPGQRLYSDPARLAAIRKHQVDGALITQHRPASSPSQMPHIEALADNQRLRSRVESLEERLAMLPGELRTRQHCND